MASWDNLGDIANVAQLTGLDAVALIGLIAKAANTARMHRKNCKQFALHLKLIGNLLEQLKISELKKYPETREPLELLEDALRRSYVLVKSCQDRSFFYLLAMGWNIVYQFRRAQSEIDQYLKIIPLITLVDNARIRERMEVINMDRCEYTFDEDDRKVQDILKREPSKHDTVVLKKTLSCSYPDLPFKEAIQKENEKLQLELRRSQAHLDVSQCEVIQHLINVTQAVAVNSSPEKSLAVKDPSKPDYSVISSAKNQDDFTYAKKAETHLTSRNTSSFSSGHDVLSTRDLQNTEEWHSDLLGCCSKPSLCFKTFFFPCGTFSRIASVANGKYMSPAEACNQMMTYTLVLSCCCYTCCIRRKLRQMLNIRGGFFDDFLSHFMCCCCALVQEWREAESRGIHGPEKTKTIPPSFQYMES
ncbi:Protein MID1-COMPLEMENTING ACTIVITY 1 [Heracleum sosnowskyi]|uniref:Protein MID1-COMPLEMENTING ACTIVITY 1 n=1 Tax=Heracleum sosnowskyi TaxID=360622 RepID=A0AAD8IKD5_9APIA|nr:Protein MID1-COMPLEMENTING ACTIVITY 1 [Heracleum sosnowskyi]